jgi:hypothetical protein
MDDNKSRDQDGELVGAEDTPVFVYQIGMLHILE